MKRIKHALTSGMAAASTALCIAIAMATSVQTRNTGTLIVTITDSATGLALHRGTVTADNNKHAFFTDDSGRVRLENLPVGIHTITARYPRYQTKVMASIFVDSAKVTTLAIGLSPSSVKTVASRPHSGTGGALVASRSGGYSIRGRRGSQNSIRINGSAVGSAERRSSIQTKVSPLAVSEVNITTSGGDGSKGGYVGGTINVTPGLVKDEFVDQLAPFGRIDVAPRPPSQFNTAEYPDFVENDFKDVRQEPLSTFSIDVDGASYSNVRHFISAGQMPPKDLVRIEEMVNYFKYDYPQPSGDAPFSITTELGACPWKPTHQLVLVGLHGKEIERSEAPPANLTFLLDVSGSMMPEERLPLIQKAFHLLVDQLRPQDRVAIVTYAGAAGLVLPPTTGEHKDRILDALDRLTAGGSTAGGEGIALAYKIARDNFDKSYNNRVILATDGDFNVGISNTGDLVRFIEAQRSSGIYLTTIGVGDDNYKDARMKQLADKGNGNYYYLDNLLEAKKVFVTQLGGTLNAIAKDVKIQVEFNPAFVRGYRLIGYEMRLLAKEDFNDDKKDAGELGSGHTVTALYEVIPSGSPADELHSVDSLRYQPSMQPVPAANSNELMMVKFRYKRPSDTTSRLITHALLTPHPEIDNPKLKIASNLDWATAVAEFGMILRDSKFKGTASLRDVLDRTHNAKGIDAEGYRAEFIKLVEMTQLLNKANN